MKKHEGSGLTEDEERRLELLQRIAGAVMDYIAPLPFEKLEEMEREARKAKQ